MLSIAEKEQSSPVIKLGDWCGQAFRDGVVVTVAIVLATAIGVVLSHYLDEENVIEKRTSTCEYSGNSADSFPG
ncbi:MAG: hypothetical protein SGJ27_20820 [Candidatus Melainabacteria bacterium]|nr:hypothetical protein [Candidatus Melainabacteria bacterium]